MVNNKALFTAFKGKNNTSFQLVNKLGGETLYITNSFSGLEKDIDAVKSEYDKVVMFGIDKKLNNAVRIEACASLGEKRIYTEADITTLSRCLSENSVTATVSHVPTRYLCNAAYFRMLARNRKAVFIHIPSLKNMTEEMMEQLIEFFKNLLV